MERRLYSISMKISELMTTFQSLNPALDIYVRADEGRTSGMRAMRITWLCYHAVTKAIVWLVFISLLSLFSLNSFIPSPTGPIGTFHCVIFLVLDYMLFLKAIFIY